MQCGKVSARVFSQVNYEWFGRSDCRGRMIQEVVFEVKFATSSWDQTIPGGFYELVRAGFPEKRDLNQISILIQPAQGGKPPSPPPVVQKPLMQTWNKSHTQVLQIGPGIAAANCMNYSNWDAFSPSIDKLLSAFLKVAKPGSVSRVAMRFINKFEFPEGTLTLGDYFQFGISVPESIKQLAAFEISFLSLLSDETGGYKAKTRVATELSLAKPVVMLDIECFIEGVIDSKLDALLKVAKILHAKSKLVFTSFVTQRTLDLINEGQ